MFCGNIPINTRNTRVRAHEGTAFLRGNYDENIRHRC